MNKKIAILALALCMVAAIAVTGTIAYFQDTEMAKNVFTVGNIDIEQLERQRAENGTADNDGLYPFEQNQKIVPAVYDDITWDEELMNWPNGSQTKVFNSDMENVMDKFVTVKNNGNVDAYARTIIAIKHGELAAGAATNPKLHVNIGDSDWEFTDWMTVEYNGASYDVTVATYKKGDGKIAAGMETSPSLQQVFLNKSATNEDVKHYNGDLVILAVTEAVQADGFDNATDALEKAFGEVNNAYVQEIIAKVE